MQLTCYESDTTLFLKQLKAQRPQLEEEQRAGRARLWDKPAISLDDQRRARESRIAQQAYVYQTRD